MKPGATLAAAVSFTAAVTALPPTTAASRRAHAAGSAKRETVVVSTRKLPRLGTVLVDRRGRTLYMFVPDKRRRVTCVRTCAAIWPPAKLPKGARPAAKGKARASLLGRDADPAGGSVVTYDGWPLYRYVGDTAPGQATGQALDLNGGLWYVLTPAGKVVRRRG